MATKSLKAANLKWLWSAVALDAVVCVLVAAPSLLENFQLSQLIKLLPLPVGPVIVVLLSQLLPSEIKASLVFWRLRYAYPGHRAFTTLGPKDHRFSMADLEKNIGGLPHEPGEQNTTWFKLYKKVENEIPVADAHGNFLLLRDLAAMSLLLVPVALIASLMGGLIGLQTCVVVGFLVFQYIAAAIGAQHSGKRMVTNVLAAHAVGDPRVAKASRRSAIPPRRPKPSLPGDD